MSVATNCPECQKRIRVPRLGVRIKCPHCKATASIPDEPVDSSEALEAAELDREPNDLVVQEDLPATGQGSSGENQSFDFLDSADDSPAVDVPPVLIETSEAPFSVDTTSDSKPDSASEVDLSEPQSDASISTTKRRTKKRRKESKEGTGSDAPPNPFKEKWYSGFLRHRKILRGEETASSLPFKLLAVYAFVVTAALGYMLFLRGDHALESLPDLKPQLAAEYRHIPADADLPPGHELRLGESRQFGNVIVRPVRVSREPLEFSHYRSESATRPAEEPVLKLWLECTVESDTAFQPLDTLLLTKRATRSDAPGQFLSNTFICKVAARKTREGAVLNYEQSVDSEWKLKQQNLDKPFQPGDRNLCYVASDVSGYQPLLDQAGPIVWRLQIRKGVSASGNGVTTLVDVVFDPGDVETAG